MRMIKEWDCGVGAAFKWGWKFGFDPSDFHGGKTFWLGPFRFWFFS